MGLRSTSLAVGRTQSRCGDDAAVSLWGGRSLAVGRTMEFADKCVQPVATFLRSASAFGEGSCRAAAHCSQARTHPTTRAGPTASCMSFSNGELEHWLGAPATSSLDIAGLCLGGIRPGGWRPSHFQQRLMQFRPTPSCLHASDHRSALGGNPCPMTQLRLGTCGR